MSDKKNVAVNVLGWTDKRFPLTAMWKAHMSEYYAPKNFNWWYIFGVLAMLVLVIQIVSGIFLTMHYKPDAELAFYSVETSIMRDVPFGWLIRTVHSTGASMFFVVVYLHMTRGLLYGSYREPRELVWIFGVAIFLVLMGEAFMGYLLPWGQMSFWGAQVIVNLFSTIPIIGEDLSIFIRGDFSVSDATLNRFFALHVIAMPLILIGLVVAHILALHEVGSNNPDGVEIKANKDALGRPLDGIPLHPYYTVHDIFGVSLFLFIFAAIVFFAPEMGGYFLEYNNFDPADSLKTPAHIAPVWYFTAFYSMLRATTDDFTWILAGLMTLSAAHVLFFAQKLKGLWKIGIAIVLVMIAVGLRIWDAKFWGFIVMGGTVVILFFLPWLDNSPVKSIRYRPFSHKVIYAVFFVNFLMLGYLGTLAPSDLATILSKIGTVIYIAFFAYMPIWSKMGTFKQVPDRVTFTPH